MEDDVKGSILEIFQIPRIRGLLEEGFTFGAQMEIRGLGNLASLSRQCWNSVNGLSKVVRRWAVPLGRLGVGRMVPSP